MQKFDTTCHVTCRDIRQQPSARCVRVAARRRALLALRRRRRLRLLLLLPPLLPLLLPRVRKEHIAVNLTERSVRSAWSRPLGMGASLQLRDAVCPRLLLVPALAPHQLSRGTGGAAERALKPLALVQVRKLAPIRKCIWHVPLMMHACDAQPPALAHAKPRAPPTPLRSYDARPHQAHVAEQR